MGPNTYMPVGKPMWLHRRLMQLQAISQASEGIALLK